MKNDNEAFQPNLQTCADLIAHENDTDIIFCNSAIERPLDTIVTKALRERKLRKNLLFILVTEGGDPDVAYRVSRSFQQNYSDFNILVSGYCKSAGALLALGAKEVVMTDEAELGPLDIQLAKKDDLGQNQSGLAIPNSLKALQAHAYSAFEQCFLGTINKSGGRITTQTASKIATDFSVGLFSPIFQQIDPLHVGEVGRANSIAEHYGQRLLRKYENSTPEALRFLITKYPCHSFVIDREEASDIFSRVRKPNESEMVLIEFLGESAIMPMEGQPAISFLNSEAITEIVHAKTEGKSDGKEAQLSASEAKSVRGKSDERTLTDANAGD